MIEPREYQIWENISDKSLWAVMIVEGPTGSGVYVGAKGSSRGTLVDWKMFESKHRLVSDEEGRSISPAPPPPIVPGSVVKLKCGGPWMVVGMMDKFEGGEEGARVCWHDNDGKLITVMVALGILKVVPEEELEGI